MSNLESLRDNSVDITKSRNDIIDLPGTGYGRLISFPSIMRTGRIPQYDTLSMGNFQIGNISVDLSRNDSYVRALNRITENTITALRGHSTIQQLLQKHPWDKNDRIIWENALTNVAIREMRGIPGLDTYRTDSDPNIKRDQSLNSLSIDIDDRQQQRFEFDCEQMSLTLGIAMQRIEDRLLPTTSSAGDLRVSSSYHFVSGIVISERNGRSEGNPHAYNISSATGNIINAVTQSGDPYNNPYMIVGTPNYNFITFLQTGIAVTSRGVFGGNTSIDEANTARERSDHAEWAERRNQEPRNSSPKIETGFHI